jgi:hypothetical protein
MHHDQAGLRLLEALSDTLLVRLQGNLHFI